MGAQDWMVIDPVVSAEKALISGSLGVEETSRRQLISETKEMTLLEKELAKKRKTSANFKSSPVFLSVDYAIVSTFALIRETKQLIKEIKRTPKKLTMRVWYLELLLEHLENMFNWILTDQGLLSAGIIVSGGPGYNYTAHQKMLDYMMNIKRPVIEINFEIKNLTLHNKAFKK